MRIQLIHPPAHINASALTALRPSAPLGLAYLAASLRKAGHEIVLLDCLAEAMDQHQPEPPLMRIGLSNAQIVQRIDPKAQVLGITNMWTYAWPGLRVLIRAIKDAFPEKILVCGGEHFTGMPEKSMRQAPIDYIVLGEGELVAEELMARLESDKPFDPGEIKGLCWRRGDDIVINPRAVRNKNIDEIPWPAWDLFDIESYNAHRFTTGTHYGKTIPILATRGCPYECTYCSNPGMWGNRWFARDPVDVADEIEYYHYKYQATHFPFQDLTASLQKKWSVAFAQELIRRGLQIEWQLAVGTRCEMMDDEVCRLLYQSGCRELYFAPESGSEETRKLIKKKMKTHALINAVDATVRAKISLGIFFVIGFPHDTVENLRDTVRLARTLALKGVQDVSIPVFYPIPSTELFDELVEKGRITDSDRVLMLPMLTHAKWVSEEQNYCENLSAAQLTFFRYWIAANFYILSYLTHPTRIWRTLKALVTGREHSKLEAFLVNQKQRMLRALGAAT